LAEPVSSLRSSSKEAEEGKSILRTMIPYGLLRVLQISIIFLFNSDSDAVSEARTNRLLKAAEFAPNPPGKRARRSSR